MVRTEELKWQNFNLVTVFLPKKMNIHNIIYLATTMKSKSIYQILRTQNCEMSFTFFSIENSIPNIKQLKKLQKRRKRIKRCRVRVKVEYLGRYYKRYEGHGSVEPCSGQRGRSLRWRRLYLTLNLPLILFEFTGMPWELASENGIEA